MEWLTPEVIATVGFPIVMAAYLLVRHEKVINELTQAIIKLTVLVERGYENGGRYKNR